MKLVEMKCKNCGSVLNVEESAKKVNCKYCNSEYYLDDEALHIKYDNMEEAGYSFEKGKIKAQTEEKEMNDEKNKKDIEEKTFKMSFAFIALFLIFSIIYFVVNYIPFETENNIPGMLTLGGIGCLTLSLVILMIKYMNKKRIDKQKNNA